MMKYYQVFKKHAHRLQKGLAVSPAETELVNHSTEELPKAAIT